VSETAVSAIGAQVAFRVFGTLAAVVALAIVMVMASLRAESIRCPSAAVDAVGAQIADVILRTIAAVVAFVIVRVEAILSAEDPREGGWRRRVASNPAVDAVGAQLADCVLGTNAAVIALGVTGVVAGFNLITDVRSFSQTTPVTARQHWVK